MSAMDLDTVEPGPLKHHGCGRESVDQVCDLVAGQGPGGAEDPAAAHGGQGAWGQGVPSDQDGGLPAVRHGTVHGAQ